MFPTWYYTILFIINQELYSETAEWPKNITIANISNRLRDSVVEAIVKDAEKRLKNDFVISNYLSFRFVVTEEDLYV